ncbi:hypothetical protein H696_03991 [Fonticula alba]|uniref:B-block binding subunit of TFIIIC domain-containing protein n=1 Tax=Fonticula alba TaxID=691883 RepID=A0A058Z5L7_FONAL|nr:hypothetical protein H696_03991 [Fonticula alba]KCV69569.1 hypothetical protein H696_03991 [Fonticula alba]|eukprot:XP_009496134.1 hypothetical protein H696_03991 [Fonticula alba]
MDEYLRVLIDEIALEGPHGHPAADLAGLLSASTGHQIDRGVVSLLWPALIRHPDARFETEPEDAPPAPMPPPHLLDKQVHALSSTSVGCKVVHRSAPALRTFAGALEHYRQRKLRLRVVASTTYRHRMLGVLNDNPFELTPVMLFVLEQAAKSRERGFPQSEVSRILSIDPRTIFSMVKSLEQAGLIFRIPFFKPGLSRTNLIVLSRFAGMSVAAALNVASRGDTSLVEEFTGIPIFLFDSARQIILSHLRASKNHSMSYDTARQLVVTRTERKADSRAPDVEPGESNDSPEQLAEVSEPAGETPQPPPAPAPTGSGCGAIVVASTGKNQEARLVRLLSRIIRSLVEMGHIEKFYTHSEGTMVMSIGLLNKSAGPAAPGRDGSSAADPASSFASVDAPRPEYLFALDRPAHLPIHHSIFRLVATAPQGVSTTRQLSIRLCTFVRTQLRLCREVGASGAIRMDNIGNVGRERHILFEPPTNLAEIAHRYGLQFDRSGHCFVNALMDASLLDAPPREVDTKDVVRMVDPDNPLALELDSRIRGGISTSRQYYSLNVVSQVRALRLALHIQRDPIIYETTLVRKLASQPLSPNDRQFLDSTGMDRRTIRRIIDVLVKANVIRVQAIRESEALDPSGTLTAEYGPDAPESSRREHDVLIGCVTPVDRARILEMVGDYVRRRRQRMAAGPAALSTRNQEVSFLEDLVLEEAADDRITLLADIASRAAEATPDADLPDEKPAVAVGQAGLTALEAAPAKRLTSRWTSTGDVGAGGGAMRATAARLLGRRALLDARSARGMFPGMDTPGAEAPDSDAGSMGEVDRVPVAPVHLRKIERLRVLYFHLHQMSSAPVAGSPDEEFPFIEGAQLMKSLTLGVLVRALGVQSDSQERLVRHLQRSTHAPVTSAGAPSTILLSRQLASVPVDWLPDQARREALLSVGWLMQPRLPAAVGPEGSAAPVATASTDVATATPTKYRILRSLPLGGATAGLGTGVGSVIMLNLLECLEELGLLQFEEQCGLSVLEFPMDRPLRPVPRFLASTFGTATGSSTDGTVAHGGLLSQSQDMVRVLVPARFRLVRHVRLKSPGD